MENYNNATIGVPLKSIFGGMNNLDLETQLNSAEKQVKEQGEIVKIIKEVLEERRNK